MCGIFCMYVYTSTLVFFSLKTKAPSQIIQTTYNIICRTEQHLVHWFNRAYLKLYLSLFFTVSIKFNSSKCWKWPGHFTPSQMGSCLLIHSKVPCWLSGSIAPGSVFQPLLFPVHTLTLLVHFPFTGI